LHFGLAAFFLFLAWAFLMGAGGCGGGGKTSGEVVLFTALDPIFSEPVFKLFEERTGIKVKALTDSEGAKTVGLANRLIRMKEHPEADVFWNNELAQTIVLKKESILAPYTPKNAARIPEAYKDPEGYWTGFAARARVVLYHKELVGAGEAPRTLEALADPKWKGKAAIALPVFGTTFTHAAALFAQWGPDRAKDWFRALQANQTIIARGNAHARNLVIDGTCAICLTDTDDANGAFLKKRPVEMIYPDQDGMGALVIPNTVALIRGGPNPENGKKLIEFLLSEEVEGILAKRESAQMPLRPGVPPYNDRFDPSRFKAQQVDWARVAAELQNVHDFVRKELKWFQ
jgi:iron(III) transport system substrate-binding protein